ncbi:Hypothetical predicted protein [Paramuricea clavata]|uniref:Uncharacterized protein n=1 Tax=Paramuricea clavata TaxID=317549 RepID=A0A7D9E2F5_PARCT|nr:Hypothetical predicted protein [Paramuricea clavata]
MALRREYERSEKVSVKRRDVHHNQLKRFHDVREPDTADNRPYVDPEEEENDLAETDDAVVVIEGPDIAAPIEDVEQDNNNPAEQPEPTNDNERPHRERRPLEWFVNYDMNF